MKTLKMVSLALCVAFVGLFAACGEQGGEETQTPDTALYGSICYFETLSGGYVKDSLYTRESRGSVGSSVSYSPEEIEGFTFDEDNANNVLFGVIAADGTTTLVAYYSRNEYDITVSGGTASKERAKYGEKVELTPSLSLNGLLWQAEGEGAKIEGNSLTVGTSNVHVRAVYGGVSLIDGETYFRAEDSAAQAVITVSEPQTESGILFLYNNEMTQNAATSSVSYYAFVASSGGVRLLFVEDDAVTVLARAETNYAAGEHTFEISVSENGAIDCTLDGSVLIQGVTPSEPITGGGRMGVYSLEASISLTSLTPLRGEMATDELRAYALRMMTTMQAEVYRFDAATSTIVSEVSEIDASDIESLVEDVRSTQELLDTLTSPGEIIAEMNTHGNALRYRLYKEMVWDSLTEVARSMNASLLLPFVQGLDETTHNADGVAIYRDVFTPDMRWYVPNAYMLYSALQDGSVFGPYSLGLLDYLKLELDSATTTAELASINGRYIEEVVRATVWHDFEFYYWSMYNKLGSENVNNVWEWFYTYIIQQGTNFVYAGCIDGYLWTGDCRLFAKWFAPDGEAVHNANQMIADFNWMRDHQVEKAPEEEV